MGKRDCLIVTVSTYDDPGLAALRSAESDATELQDVLGSDSIGRYDVAVLQDRPYHELGEGIADFLADRRPEDHLLLYISGHGVKNDEGALHIAAPNTRLSRLEATSLPTPTIARQMERSRAGSVLLVLDCCFAGAFPSGFHPKGPETVDFSRFGGDGRVVIAASSSTEYAFEGQTLVPDDLASREERPAASVFTAALVSGLRNGDADVNADGVVSVSDLFGFLTERMRDSRPTQTPSMHASSLKGDIAVAYNPFIALSNPAKQGKSNPQATATDATGPMLISRALEAVLDIIEAVGTGDVLSSGLQELDNITGGFRKGELVVFTAPPGIGRSTLALNTVRATGITENLAVMLISSEMGKSEIVMRMMSAEAKIPVNNMRRGPMTEMDWNKLVPLMGPLAAAPIYINDVLDHSEIANWARQIDEKQGLRLIVVDPLVDANEAGDRARVLQVSRDLKNLARELDLVVLTTLEPHPEFTSGGRTLDAVDKYMDVIVEIDRPDAYEQESSRAGEADLTVIRSRIGPTGTVTVAFQGHYSRFVDMAY